MNGVLAFAVPAFIAGLMGSAHCVGMCGGLSGLFAAKQAVGSAQQSVPLALAYNGGRILSYVALGALVAGLGGSLLNGLPELAMPLRISAGVLVVLMGLQIAFGIRLLAPIERAGGRLWTLVSPLVRGLLPMDTVPRAASLGLLWGLLPCGLVYSMLAVSLAGSQPVYGAIAMFAFGLGTLPSMLLTGFSAWRLSTFCRNKRLAAGGLLVGIGLLTLAMPAWHAMQADEAAHAHHAALES